MDHGCVIMTFANWNEYVDIVVAERFQVPNPIPPIPNKFENTLLAEHFQVHNSRTCARFEGKLTQFPARYTMPI